MYELSRHPTDQDRIRAWIANCAIPVSEFTMRHDTPVAELILETLRLYPSGWAMFRETEDALELEPGVTISAGSRICVSPYVTHRLPDLWPEPESFAPARFADQASLAQAYSQFRFFPFAGGVHRCIGEGLALMVIGMVLSELLMQFDLSCEIEEPLKTLNKLCLEPAGSANFVLHRRPAVHTSAM